MVVVVFRSRLKPDLSAEALGELEQLGGQMYELASSSPGFVSYKDFTAEDGESVAIVEFDTAENLLAWRDAPEHRKAQQSGRDEFLSEYRISVCTQDRESVFPA